MTDEREGVERLRWAVDEVAATLPPRPRGTPPVPVPRSAAATWGLRPDLRAALAAGIAVAVLSYPAFLGLDELPREKARVAELQAAGQGPSPAGPVDLQILSLPRSPGDLRDPGRAQKVERYEALGGQALLMLLEPDAEAIGSAEAGGYGIEMRRADGERVRSWDLDPVRLGRWMDLHEGVPLLLPPGEFPAGRYEVRWTRRTAAGAELISAASFEIVRR